MFEKILKSEINRLRLPGRVAQVMNIVFIICSFCVTLYFVHKCLYGDVNKKYPYYLLMGNCSIALLGGSIRCFNAIVKHCMLDKTYEKDWRNWYFAYPVVAGSIGIVSHLVFIAFIEPKGGGLGFTSESEMVSFQLLFSFVAGFHLEFFVGNLISRVRRPAGDPPEPGGTPEPGGSPGPSGGTSKIQVHKSAAKTTQAQIPGSLGDAMAISSGLSKSQKEQLIEHLNMQLENGSEFANLKKEAS